MDDKIKAQAEAAGVTPAELGQDPERLPGQVPELDAADKAQTKLVIEKNIGPQNSMPIPPGTPEHVAKAFRLIPQRKVNDYKALWDGFINKDMPFPEFACELFLATSPAQMQRDLENIVMLKQAGLVSGLN